MKTVIHIATGPFSFIEFSKWIASLTAIQLANILNYLNKIRIIKQNDIEYLISDNQNYDPIFINQNQDIVVIGKITKLIVENFN